MVYEHTPTHTAHSTQHKAHSTQHTHTHTPSGLMNIIVQSERKTEMGLYGDMMEWWNPDSAGNACLPMNMNA